MRLKTLEIKGFKSFANETVINFGEDVIGIVGPNGSGKSNIVDSIRWVLGEQKSRELRLDQMSSVIFNGTKKRRASGLAQVALTFENTKNLLPTDYNTVTISRRLYRSGDSEYRLNDVPCRLKDITSLFLDTGIGSNSYAIIALGMVDDILADKDNSRRRMFEQAAGISKYKMRKKETLRKLKSTSDDLERIEDLLFEREKNLKSLEKQAKRTRKYFEIKEKYKQLSIELAIKKVALFKERRDALNKQLEQEENRYREFEAQIHRLEAQLEKEKKANLDKEKALSDKQKELNTLVGQIRGMENDKKMQEQRIGFVEQTRKKLTEQMVTYKAKISQLEESIEYYREELNAEKRIEAQLEEQLEIAEEKLAQIRKNHGALKADLDAVVREQQRAERELFELEKQKAVNTNQIDNNKKDIGRSHAEIEKRQQEVLSLKEKVADLEAQEATFNEQLEQLQEAENQRQKSIKSAEQDSEQLRREIEKLNRDLDAKRNEYKLTKSMVESLEGFPESIKFLKKKWKVDAPLLSDLIYVKEGYRVAIENFLEPYLNYYVVENQAEAIGAIRLLSKSQKGKANFFILDAFEDFQPVNGDFNDAQKAIDLVETDPKYMPLCQYLLENVWITDQKELPQEVLSEEVVLLSKTGHFIKRSRSVSGGSVGLFEGKKIGRKKNLEILSEAINRGEEKAQKLSTAFYEIQSELKALKNQNIQKQIQQQQRGLNQLVQQRVSLKTRLENFEGFIAEVNEKVERFERKIADLVSVNAIIDNKLKDKNDLVLEAKQKIANTDGSFRQVAEQLSTASTDFNQKNIAFIKQQNKVNTFQRELSFRVKQLEETRANLAKDQRNIQKAAEELEEIQDNIIQLEEDLRKSYGEKKNRANLLNDSEQAYYKSRGLIHELEEKIRKINKSSQDSRFLINTLKDKFTQVKFDIRSIAERLRIEFNVNINEVINRPAETNLSDAELQVKVDKMKSRLDNYGEINPLAVEAYDEMKEQYDLTVTQRDDILQAKEDLMATIKEIEETATAQFIEAFDKARLYFIDVFRSLFTEDDACDLILLDPDNPLESKIEIVAKPKGKRPQTIAQLSGGEKTLTATALLFALYLLKPAPFCIFDEVDAPLDDANIEKFNKIVKKFSKDSQFIIVTHNKLTMAAVDVIYGVHMQEMGISEVVPVDFRAKEHIGILEAVG